MDWLTVAQLVIGVGLPAAEKIIAKWENNGPVTLAEFQEIRAEAEQTAHDRMLARLQAAGIDPNSDQGKTLLGLTAAPPVLQPAPPIAPPTA